MLLRTPNDSCSDYLTYDAAAVGSYASRMSNQIVITSRAQKRLDGVQACWNPIAGATDPATLRSARLLVVEGFISGSVAEVQDIFVDPILPMSAIKAQYSFTGRVLLDILTSGGSHRIITLGNLGLNTSADTITILQTPMYRSGDADGQPGATLATLSIQLSEFYDKQTQYDFAKTLK